MAAARCLRTYVTRDEVTALLRAAKKTRHSARNHAMILIAYRHGLRASEAVGLRWSDVDLERATIYCRRAKNSRSTVHPLKRDEVTALDRLQWIGIRRAGEYVFASERGERMTFFPPFYHGCFRPDAARRTLDKRTSATSLSGQKRSFDTGDI